MKKSIKGIAREINELALKARNKQLSQKICLVEHLLLIIPVHLGPFHQWNYKSSTSDFTSRIYCKKPVVIDDMIAIRSMVNLCISIDHRILDGVQTGRFMSQVKERIEQFTIENTSIYTSLK